MLLCQDVPGLQWERRLLTLMQTSTSANLQGSVSIWSCVTAQMSHPLFRCNSASPARARSIIRVYGTGLSLLISHQTAESAYITPTSLYSQQRYLCLQRLIHPINAYLRKVGKTALGKCPSLSTKYEVSSSDYFGLSG